MRGKPFRGFTLIELLTVTSLLSLLAALLFPVLASAKRAALRTSCQSNLHQVGIAFSLYANDYDDQCPYAIDQATRDELEYDDSFPEDKDHIPDMAGALSVYMGGNADVFRCPSDKRSYSAYTREVFVGTFPSYSDYARSSYVFWRFDYFGRTLSSLVSDPKRRICRDQSEVWHSEYEKPSMLTNTTNSLFGDGHVRFTPLNISAL